MSTAVISPIAIGSVSGTHVPLTRLVRVELRKMVDTRAGLWLFVAIGLVTTAAVAVMLFVAKPADLTYANLVNVTLTPQGFLLPILGILAITSEWSQRTGLVTFTLEPSRTRVVTAKFLSAFLVGLLAVVVGLVVAAGGNLLGMALQDGNGSWAFGGEGLRDILILQISAILQGLAFGMLLMSSAAAIVLYFVLPIAWSMLFSMVARLADAAPWLDLGTAQMPLTDHSTAGADWTHLGVTTMLWIVLPLALGAARLLRSEVK